MYRRRLRQLFAVAGATILLAALAAVAQGATGDLSGGGCLSGDTATGPSGTSLCTLTETATAAGASSGLDAPQVVRLSPDGTSAYAVAQQDDAIVHFERDTTTGALSFEECITGETESGPAGTGGSDACLAGPSLAAFPSGDTGLDSPTDVVVSPNGASVYVISANDDSVMHFSRDPGTGALSFVSCLSAETATTTGSGGPCTATSTAEANGTNSGLDSPSGIAISPGGNTLYVTSASDDAIAGFTRNTGTGAIAYVGCVTAELETSGGGTANCSDAETLSSGGTDTGLNTPYAPVVSADGETLYVGTSADASVAWFDRGPLGGLTWNDCITGETDVGPTGSNACSAVTPTATAVPDGGNSGLDRTQALVMSSDDASLYTGSQLDDGLAHFSRDTVDGDLTWVECISGENDSAGCTQIPSATANGVDSGLEAVQALAVSPDGKNLYTAAVGDDAMGILRRDPGDGSLEWQGCRTGETATGPAATGACAAPAPTPGGAASGLDNLRGLAVSPDGLWILGAAELDDSIAFVARSNAPETTIESAPEELSSDRTATFTFSADEDGVEFECSVDGAAFAACSGVGTHTTDVLGDGDHTFAVRALNDVDEPDPTPAADSFAVDGTAPETSIASGPDGPIAESSAEFSFTGSGGAVAFECRLDDGPFAACASPKGYTGLGEGAHTFEVRAVDAADNADASPASRSFSVDTTAPETTLTRKPKNKVKTNKAKKRAKFGFESSEPDSSFECKRDKGKKWKSCDSPYSKKYKLGKHVFKVRAIDALGNVDGSAASDKWKHKRKN